MSAAGKRKVTKLPDLRPNLEEELQERELTDPPILRKGYLKPTSNHEPDKNDTWKKLVDIFQKTQIEFSHIYRQILAITERQEIFDARIMECLSGKDDVKSKERGQKLRPGEWNKEEMDLLQPRFRYFLVDCPEATLKLDTEKLKRWIGRVFFQTFSVAFHRYLQAEMNFEQTKIYCSANILRNLLNLTYKVDLTPNMLATLEQEMTRLLKYLQLKYPLVDSTQVNKALEGAVQQIDNMGLLAHNYFANSNIVFEWREDANYNDLIMHMLNDILSRIDRPSNNHRGSHFRDFKDFMTNLFQSIEEEDEEDHQLPSQSIPGVLDFIADRYVKARSGVRDQQPRGDLLMKDSSKIRQEKQKYREKVREYTKYVIGRKIPQNFSSYTAKEIQSKNLKIKSPAVLRILTKWAEQLRSKFITPAYYLSLSDGIRSQKNGTVHSLLFPFRLILDEEVSKEEKDIQAYLNNSAYLNLDLQLKLMKKQLRKFEGAYDDLVLEEIAGKYSIQVVNSLHSNLIGYLNRLIHGLTSVAKRFYERIKGQESQWASPPDLVTFTLGDLLRCKISSKEKQILRVYDQIKLLSLQSPDRLKIIRVKNRLSTTTNDILVNIKFNNFIIAQVQLAVKTEASHFTNCSNSFCHYLYQLERSPFGPIAELCNVWAALDRTAQYYKDILELEATRQIPVRAHTCTTSSQQSYERPFICYSCEVVYYHSNYLRSHVQCQQCKEIICAKCLIRKESPQDLKGQFISNRALRVSCKQMIERINASSELLDEGIPELGVCVSVEERAPQVQIFCLLQHSNQKFLLARQGGQIYEIQKVQTPKQIASFLRKYLIFRLNPEEADRYIDITIQQALQTFILPKALGIAYRKSKESLVLGDKLSTTVLSTALKTGSPEGKTKIHKIFFDSNLIDRVDFIAENYKNLVLLQLSYNPIKSLDGLEGLCYLKSLSLAGCNLEQLPSLVFQQISLEELRLSKNKLSLVEGLGQLKRLKLLDLSSNGLHALPGQIGQCVSLILLRLQDNQLLQLPKEIQGLTQLRTLVLSNNQLTQLPLEIGNLSSLEELYVRDNQLERLPEQLGRLFNLEKLDLSSNRLKELPLSVGELHYLLELNLSKNPVLKELPRAVSNLNQLQVLRMSACNFESLPLQICQLATLKQLNISHNRLTSLPLLELMPALEHLDLSNNKLESQLIGEAFSKLLKLQMLNLRGNYLTVFPNLTNCEKLFKADLSYNSISLLREEDIQGLQALQICNMSHNRLQRIPGALLTLPKLMELDLASNRLSNFGDGLTSVLPSLLKVNLADNQLIQIPNCLLNSQKGGDTSHIAAIDVSCNRIQELPVDLVRLRHLKVLNCGRNNLKKLTGELERFIRDKKIETDDRQLIGISPARKTYGKFRELPRAP